MLISPWNRSLQPEITRFTKRPFTFHAGDRCMSTLNNLSRGNRKLLGRHLCWPVQRIEGLTKLKVISLYFWTFLPKKECTHTYVKKPKKECTHTYVCLVQKQSLEGNVKFWGQSLSRGHYQTDKPASQIGVCLFDNPPINFHIALLKKLALIWWQMRIFDQLFNIIFNEFHWVYKKSSFSPVLNCRDEEWWRWKPLVKFFPLSLFLFKENNRRTFIDVRWQGYLGNNPLQTADNIRNRDIVREMNIWQRAEASMANAKFWGHYLSQGHYQLTHQQARRGFINLITLPLISMSHANFVAFCTFRSSIWEQLFNVDTTGANKTSSFIFYVQ